MAIGCSVTFVSVANATVPKVEREKIATLVCDEQLTVILIRDMSGSSILRPENGEKTERTAH